MSIVIFEHVTVGELPDKWREKLGKASNALVTVRIEDGVDDRDDVHFVTDDPAFGIWRDHPESTDVEAYPREMRESRHDRDGSRRKP